MFVEEKCAAAFLAGISNDGLTSKSAPTKS